jgi:hypothetical protein
MKRFPGICFTSILLFLVAGNLTVHTSASELNQNLEKQDTIEIDNYKSLFETYSALSIVQGNYERLAAEVFYKHLFSPVDDLLNILFPKYARKLEYRFVQDK